MSGYQGQDAGTAAPGSILSKVAKVRPFRHILTVSIVAAFFIASACRQDAAPPPIDAELQRLQGTWKGVDPSDQKVTVTIAGDSLRFFRDANFWFETAIALPANTNPKQLYATVKACPPSQAASLGKTSGAIYKMEGETLTLVAYALSEEPPTTFDGATSLYVLKKVRP